MKGILITGGTGTFGRAFASASLPGKSIPRIVIYSRDEQKQEEMARELAPIDPDKKLRFMLGDVRDVERLKMAMRGCGTVVHAAALKIVPKCEYDPIEAVKTNVDGASNVIRAAIDAGIDRVIALSTDKAVAPVNLYGATKLTAERLFIAANHLSGSPGDKNATRFSVVRYGNVANSRGSVIPLFKRLAADGKPLPITHPSMTRFWITIDQAVNFVLECILRMEGGEIFIPKMPSFKILDLVYCIAPGVFHDVIGSRPGEKMHETLVTPHDVPKTVPHSGYMTIQPAWCDIGASSYLPSDFVYSSDTNNWWLSVDELRELIK